MSITMRWTCAVVFVVTISMYTSVNAADSGMRTPRFPRAMKLDTFLSEIATGSTYEELYLISDVDNPDFVPLLSFTITLTAQSVGLVDPRVTQRVDGRIPGGPCVTQTSQLRLVKQRAPCKRAIFEAPTVSGTGSGVDRFFYFTTKPEEYLAELACLLFENGECQAGFFFNLYTIRAPPNQFDWKRAVKEVRRQVGLDFTDPRSSYIFRLGAACPDP